ncbi:MAG TPA: HAD-IA family hydrolase [Prosthecobacter sp.]
MPLKAVFFDAAGTLIEPAEPVGATYARFAAQHGIQTDATAVMQAFRAAWKASPPALHPVGQCSEDDDRGWWKALVADVFARVLGVPVAVAVLERLFPDLYEHFARPEAWMVYEDVRPALEDLSRDHHLLVLSNFDRRLRSILAGHELSHFFSQVILSSEVGAAKPHARMFDTALSAAGCAPGECLHVGDDAKCDMVGAESAGIHFFAVHRPENSLQALVQKVRSGAYSGLRSPRK